MRTLPILACALALPADARDEPSPRPNLLFVFSDDHAAQAISAYGSNLCETPSIDRLAQEGMLFANCFCGNSICAPSRATVLTGLHTHAHGVIDNGIHFDGSQRTFPKLLRAAGYQTALVGKWHLKSEPTGFDHWQVLVGQGPYYNPPIWSPEGREPVPGYTTDVIHDLALEWLEDGRDPERPFLLMLQNKAPHRNWLPGPNELGMYDDTVFPEPATLFDDWGGGRTSACAQQEMTLRDHMSLGSDLKLDPPRGLSEAQLAAWNEVYDPKREAFEAAGLEGDALVRWKYQRYMQDYLGCIAAVDRGLGRVLDWLDESGLAASTVVAYSSDQGFYLGEHGWYDKRWMYEESLRMPLLVRWPGVVAPGSRCERLVQNIDFAPTFLELAGADPAPGMHGESFVSLLRGEDPPGWRESVYYHYYEFPAVHMVNRHYGVRTERYKLIHYYQLDEWELFDLERDPDELTSVHADPEYAEVRSDLGRELRRLQLRYGEEDPRATPRRIYQADARRRAAGVEPRELFRLADLEASVPEAPAVRARPFTIGALVEPPAGAATADGVVASQGGESTGWTLEVVGGRAVFCVRNRDQVFELVGPVLEPGKATHVAAQLDAAGEMALLVEGEIAARGVGELLEREPAEGLALGADPGTAVSSRSGERRFPGTARDVRFAVGELDPAVLMEWVAGR